MAGEAQLRLHRPGGNSRKDQPRNNAVAVLCAVGVTLLGSTLPTRRLTTSGCARQCRWHWTWRQLTIHTSFKGGAISTPHGKVGTAQKGLFVPFEEWPEEVKKGYRYDLEGAENLLDEAGYPRGADGTIRFKTSVILHANAVMELLCNWRLHTGVRLALIWRFRYLSTGAEFGAVL